MARRTRFTLAALAVVAGLTLLAGFTSLADFLAKPLVRNESPDRAGAIIILGGGVRKRDGLITRSTAERLAEGVRLWKEGYAPVVVFTGGQVPRNPFNEAQQAKPVLEGLGVPAEVTILEDQAKNTYENAVDVQAIATDNGWEKLLVVTSPFHTKRACRTFEKQELDIICHSADPSILPPPDFFERIRAVMIVLREYGATAYFALRGYL